LRAVELRLTGLFLLGVAAVCWLVTAERMDGMDMGPGTDLGAFGWFAGVWSVMMAAMMLPSLVPMAATYAGRARDDTGMVTPQSLTGTTLFVAGYLLLWVIAGIASWTLVEGVRSLDPAFLYWDDGGRYVAGAMIAGAALYELSPMKARCLRHCRDRALLVADWRTGSIGAFRMGFDQGAYCIGSSWALMAALFALGVMSITWMIVIAALIAAEKLLPSSRLASAGIVVVLGVLGASVALSPDRVPGLTVPGSPEAMRAMEAMGMEEEGSDGAAGQAPMNSMGH
jgi:predicted metal-binding membrane protein